MKPFRQNLDTINRLLGEMAEDPERAMKAYCLGVISSIAEGHGVTAPDAILEAAAQCRSMDEFQDFYLTIGSILEARGADASGHAASCPDGGAR